MTEDRKATDILAEILTTQQEILGYVRNINSNNQLILKKLASAKNSVPESLPPTHNKKQPSQLEQRLKLDDAEQDEQAEMLTTKTTPRFPNPEKKVAIVQQISYKDGKNVFLAGVEIKDIKGNLVGNSRTANNGKYQIAVVPGTYNVKVRKAGTSLKPEINLDYQIVVPMSDAQVELPSQKI